MMRSLYSGISGLKSHQTRMDVIGNNIANINTIGFKGSRTTFSDMLSQLSRNSSAATDTRGGVNPNQIGLGVNVESIDLLFRRATGFSSSPTATNLTTLATARSCSTSKVITSCPATACACKVGTPPPKD